MLKVFLPTGVGSEISSNNSSKSKSFLRGSSKNRKSLSSTVVDKPAPESTPAKHSHRKHSTDKKRKSR